MLYEELHRRYGTNIAQRVRRELDESDFNRIEIDNLTEWLEERAEAAHEQYKNLQNNPPDEVIADTLTAGEACRRWREYEDLAYLVAIAEDVSHSARSL